MCGQLTSNAYTSCDPEFLSSDLPTADNEWYFWSSVHFSSSRHTWKDSFKEKSWNTCWMLSLHSLVDVNCNLNWIIRTLYLIMRLSVAFWIKIVMIQYIENTRLRTRKVLFNIIHPDVYRHWAKSKKNERFCKWYFKDRSTN